MTRPLRHLIALSCSALLLAACADSDNGGTPDEQRVGGTVRSELARETAPDVPDADLDTLVSGGHAFALDLYQELDTDDSNFMVSPLSIRMAFGLLQAGARGTTADEIAGVLHYGLEGEALHAAFNALDLALAERNFAGDDDFDPIQLHVANAFWGQTGYAWKADYLDTIAVHYGAGVETMPFATDPGGARETINTWVEDRTEDRIQDLLPEGSIGANTVAVLTNALYFKAPWATPFEAFATRDAAFTTPSGQTVTTAFMNQIESFGYTAGEGYEALEMPFHQGELSMVFVLPSEGTFDAFEAALDVATMEAILDDFATALGRVSIPKFEFEAGFLLSDALRALGMETAFLSADLSGMIDNGDLFIDEVYHKTFIAVDEAGAEAAAATAIVVGETSAPVEEFEFVADRPFVFLIRDRVTGEWLFFGRVTDPTA